MYDRRSTYRTYRDEISQPSIFTGVTMASIQYTKQNIGDYFIASNINDLFRFSISSG